MKKRFGELPIGSRFCFGARRYEKVAAEIGRDEDRGGNVFHARTEVLVETLPVCSPARKRNVVAPTPPVVQDQALRKKERARVPEDARERALAKLEVLCPPYESRWQPRDPRNRN